MKIRTVALFAASAIALAACSNQPAEETPVAETNVANIVEAPANVVELAPETPSPPPVENVASATPAPAPTLSSDEQTLDDADATGMTAKVNRDEDSQPARQ